MGKLADLKGQRDEMDWEHPDRVKIEGEINSIEQWCIDNKKGYITKLSTWSKGHKKWRSFGFEPDEFEYSDNFIIEIKEDRVIIGDYICEKCRNICIHHVLFNWCVVCNVHPQVVNYRS